jgi:hypothetical protein
VFVANYGAMRGRETGELVSFSVWGRGIVTLLPRSDMVGLMENPDKEPVLARWEHVAEVGGDLMEPLDLWPERYRVDEFPSAGQLRAVAQCG